MQNEKKTFNMNTRHDTHSEEAQYVVLWVNVEERCTKEPQKDDEWDTGDHEEMLTDYGVSIGPWMGRHYINRSVSLNKEQIGFFPKVDDKVYMVIEAYKQGDTFGSTSPCFKPVKIFMSRADAKDWLLSNEAEQYKDNDYFGGHIEYLVEPVDVMG